MTGRLSLEIRDNLWTDLLYSIYSLAIIIFFGYIPQIYYLDYFEEQSGELETLRCIYTEGELIEVSTSPICFQIHVEPASGDGEDCSGKMLDNTAEPAN